MPTRATVGMGVHAASCAPAVVLLLLLSISLASSNSDFATTARHGGLDREELEWLRKQDKISYRLKVTKTSEDPANVAPQHSSFSMEAFRGLPLCPEPLCPKHAHAFHLHALALQRPPTGRGKSKRDMRPDMQRWCHDAGQHREVVSKHRPNGLKTRTLNAPP